MTDMPDTDRRGQEAIRIAAQSALNAWEAVEAIGFKLSGEFDIVRTALERDAQVPARAEEKERSEADREGGESAPLALSDIEANSSQYEEIRGAVDLSLPLKLSGSFTREYTADEWAVLTEHLVVSPEAGKT